jgi:thiol peroxidase
MARTVTFKGEAKNLAGPGLKVGDKAPDFSCVGAGLSVINLAATPAKARMFSVVPSLDTGVCAAQTKKFNEQINALKDKVACYTVSLDLPFAQKRFCDSEGITNMANLSDVRDHSFGKNYGVLIEGLPLPLLARSVFIVDKSNKITYLEIVPEVTSHPDYDKAVAALQAAAG